MNASISSRFLTNSQRLSEEDYKSKIAPAGQTHTHTHKKRTQHDNQFKSFLWMKEISVTRSTLFSTNHDTRDADGQWSGKS